MPADIENTGSVFTILHSTIAATRNEVG